MVSIIAIVVYIVMVIIIIIEIVAIIGYNNSLKTCENRESPYCYTISCQGSQQGLCKGYAERYDSAGNLYCSYNPETIVQQ